MRTLLMLGVLGLAGTAMATNGMNLIGYGANSALTAGGRLANPNPSALVGNPALLADVTQPMLCGSLTLLMPSLTYTDNANPGGVDGEAATFPLPFIGYARPVTERLVAGVCGHAQGGMGVDFQGLNTAFGSQDDIYSNVAYMRLTGGFAYRAGETSSVGLSVSLGYAMLEFDYFPNTMVDMNGDMQPEFNGMSATELTSFGYNAKLGFRNRVLDGKLDWGAWFGTQAAVDFDGGTLEFASGQSFDAKFKDFSWPAEIGLGMAWQVAPKVTLVSDLVHYGWRDAVDEPALETDNAMINGMLPPFQMHWKNRTAMSVGAKVQVTDNLTALAGYNHADSPVPGNLMNALFPAIVEDHITLGARYRMGGWNLLGGVEIVPEASQTNAAADDMTDYFGMMNTTIDHSQLSLHLGFSKSF